MDEHKLWADAAAGPPTPEEAVLNLWCQISGATIGGVQRTTFLQKSRVRQLARYPIVDLVAGGRAARTERGLKLDRWLEETHSSFARGRPKVARRPRREDPTTVPDLKAHGHEAVGSVPSGPSQKPNGGPPTLAEVALRGRRRSADGRGRSESTRAPSTNPGEWKPARRLGPIQNYGDDT